MDNCIIQTGTMRRKDRELSSPEEIFSVIDQCKVVRVAFPQEDVPYLVPLNFGYHREGEKLTLYFHGAFEGRKMELLRNRPRVSFEMDCGHELTGKDTACSYGFLFQSVIGWGTAEIVEGEAEKILGLERLMFHQTGREFSITPKEAASVAVFRIQVESLTGKARRSF